MDSVKPGSSLSPFQQAEGEAGDKAAKLTEAPEASFGRRTVSPKPSEAIKPMSLSPESVELGEPRIIHNVDSFISDSLKVIQDELFPTQDQASCSYASYEMPVERSPKPDESRHEGEDLSEPLFKDQEGMVWYCIERLSNSERKKLNEMSGSRKKIMEVHKGCHDGQDSDRKLYALHQLRQTEKKFLWLFPKSSG